MTEETLKCPFCDGEVFLIEGGVWESDYACSGHECILKILLQRDVTNKELIEKVNLIKQKSYSDGYNRGMAEWLELTTNQTIEKVQQEIKHDLEILDQTAKLKQSWVDEGYEQGQQELFEYLASLDEKVLATVLNLGYEKYRPKKANKELES